MSGMRAYSVGSRFASLSPWRMRMIRLGRKQLFSRGRSMSWPSSHSWSAAPVVDEAAGAPAAASDAHAGATVTGQNRDATIPPMAPATAAVMRSVASFIFATRNYMIIAS